MTENEKGFTLIEIIAVLIILSILVALAVPRYVDLMQQAKISSAKGEVAEMKSSLNLAYAKLLLSTAKVPTAATDVIAAAVGTSMPITVGTAPDDWVITITGNADTAKITVNQRGTDHEYTATGTWNMPQ